VRSFSQSDKSRSVTVQQINGFAHPQCIYLFYRLNIQGEILTKFRKIYLLFVLIIISKFRRLIVLSMRIYYSRYINFSLAVCLRNLIVLITT